MTTVYTLAPTVRADYAALASVCALTCLKSRPKRGSTSGAGQYQLHLKQSGMGDYP